MSSRPKVLFGLLGLGLTVSVLGVAPAAQADLDPAISSFPYTQDWSNAGLITANDDWSGVGGVEGFLGQDLTTTTGTDPQTLLAAGSLVANDKDVAANLTATATNGGVVEVQGDTIAIQGSGTADAPYVAFHLNLTGKSDANFAFDARDLDAGIDNTTQQIAVHYRVGNSGAYTNLPGGYIADASTGPSLATLVTPVSVALPAETDGQADVYVRVMTTNAPSNDELIGIDNINITATDGGGEPDPLAATSPGNKTGEIDQPITPFTMTATGGTEPYSWSAVGLPAGVSINETTGEVSGTPTETCTCAVTVTVTDGADPVGTDDVEFTFTVNPAPEVTPIHEIQGTGPRSPFAPATGNTAGDVKTVQGIVTALYRTGGFNGMFVQTAGTGGLTDATPGASDALFVFGGSNAVNIPAGIVLGDSVRVTGPVSEFFDSTQITPANSAAVVELGAPLDPVTGLEIAYPTTTEGREAQEGMLLAPTDTFTVTNTYQTNGFAEIGLATGDIPLVQPTEVAAPDDTAGLEAVDADNAARAVTLDDGATINYLGNNTNKAIPLPWLTGTTSPPRVGAQATFHDPVILDWRNSLWKFQPQAQITDSGSDLVTFEDTRATNLVPADVGGDITLATFNVLNYFNTTGEAYVAAGPLQTPPVDTHCTYYNDRQSNRIGNNQCGTRGPGIDPPNDGRGPRGAATTASLERQEDKLVHTINALDASIIALEEIESSIKLVGETNRDDAVAGLVALLNAADPGKWKYVKSPGEATSASGVAEQDVIRNAFIYQPALVTPVGQSDMLFGTTQFANAREPLAQAFKAAGAPNSDAFAVIANHFKSKGDSGQVPATGDNANDPYVGAYNGDRERQATRLLQFANNFAADRDIEAVFLAGDFNAYTMEEPIQILGAGGFELVESTDTTEESYSFDGRSGSVDHILGNTAAMDMVTGADIWEINANESIAYQYSRYNYNATIFFDAGDPFATSDHNPEIVGLDLPPVVPTTTKQIQVLGTNDFHGRLLPDGGNAAGAAPFATAVEELRAENPNTIFTAAGDLIGASTFESFIQDDEPTIDALNEMGLEVSAAGNHEFDQGYEDLVGRVQNRANWEYIAANIDEPEGRDDLAESWTKTVDGVDIGFVGAVTEDLPVLVNPAGMTGVTVLDIVDSVNAEAAALKTAGADVVVLLVHEGSPSTDCSSTNFTDPATAWGNIVQNTSADVDAIISGHTHLAYNCRYTVQDWVDETRTVTKRPVVSAGQYGTNLNQLVFNFDTVTDQLLAIDQDVIGTAGVGYAPDPDVQLIVDAAVDFAETAGAAVLGQIDGPFNRAIYNPASAPGTENRGGESTLGNLVAEVQRWATQLPEAGVEADIAFMNPGGLRADMAGVANGGTFDLTYREAANVQPFANTLVNMVLTGEQIETLLEQQWQRTLTGNVPSRPFLRLGVSEGFTYTYTTEPETVSVPPASPVQTTRGEVTGMWLNGVPIDPAAPYSVTVNSFLGTGGDNFHELANGTNKVDTGKVDLQAMVDYMAEFAPVGTPLPVDYSQRAVEVEFPVSAPATYGEGDTVEFAVASWSMSNAGDVKDTEIQVKLGADVLDTATLDNTIGTQPYDDYGTASVSFALPADLTDGDHELTLVGQQTGTEVPVVIQVDDGITDVQILGTNDFHGRLVRDEAPLGQDCDDYVCPAAVLSGAVKELRGENPNTVFAAAGDLIGASTFESFVQDDEPTIDALNEAGLEVSAVGNHEFDQGYEDLVGRVQDRATWEYIGANVEEPAGRDDLAETWTKDFGGITVGFVGAVTEELPALVSPAGIEGVTVTDIVDATNAAAADLKAGGADMVVLLVHEGSPSTSCASPNFTDPNTVWGNITQNTSADVDAIISGHTHLAYNCSFPVQEWVDANRAVTERPVVSAGQYGQNLNQLVFSVDDATGEVAAKTQAVLALTEANFTEDPNVVSIVHDAIDFAAPIGAQVLGPIAAPFNRAKLANGTTENRGGESTLGNLVAEVQREQTPVEQGGAQIAFMNPGGLRADMIGTLNGDVRELTYRQAATVQPFANGLTNMDLTGAQIETVLEQQWQRTADGPSGTVASRPFLRLGVSEGFTYTYVETPVTVNGVDTFQGEVTGMWLNGVAIDPETSYSVTVNAFLASGGDNFREFANGSGKAQWGVTDLQAMVTYMDEQTASSPLPVDYSQRAVEVHNVADSYTAGQNVEFDVASWTMSAPGDVKDTEVQVKLGDTVLGTATLDNTIGTAVYDQYGTAHVDVALPDGTPAGAVTLTLVGQATGTEVIVPITVAKADSTVTGTNVSQVYGQGSSMHVTVSADGVVPTGRVVLRVGDVVLGQAQLTDGEADVPILSKRVGPGSHQVTISYLGDGSVKPSTGTATLTVAKATPTVVGTRTVLEYGSGSLMAVRVGATGVVPTGKVTLRADGVVLGTGTLTDGMTAATILAKRVPPGVYEVTISYSGDPFVRPGTGTATLVVQKATPTVIGFDTSMQFGQSGTMTVRVKATGVVPTGTVFLKADGVLLGPVATLVDGRVVATLVRNRLPASATPYTVTIRYSGDEFVKAGTGTASLTVRP
ncbi:ExeM/NucH family extracellular endonuclease [Nocardioides pelophilus]|uniref:ExeM/NucH family extracellular endonuclease n=1 Tax=Nocardioides pelophilus TaxID=2172019 RepID=UPI001600D01C|nr:ExeM/NucH family extracellular endonuclease [Nocardioides pelophilus]